MSQAVSATPQSAPRSAPGAAAPENDVHIVLFGLPGSGKTSLLASLGHLAQTRKEELGGTLTDTTGKLSALAQEVKQAVPARTHEEIVAYPIRYESSPGTGATRTLNAVLLDCSGEAARQLIGNSDKLEEDEEGSLAQEVAEADTLVLVVDASARGEELDRHFVAFGEFLAALRVLRGERTEVAGLPVFLVLNRCDLLAHSDDNTTDWVESIEQRKQAIGQRFRDFLARKEAEQIEVKEQPSKSKTHDVSHTDALEDALKGGFGQLELHVWATANRHPVLLSGTGSDEPYGVASLFRQCLTKALDYQERCQTSHRRLIRMVTTGLLTVLSGLIVIAGMLLFNHPSPIRQLEMSADDLRFSDRPTAAERLTGSTEELETRRALLAEVARHPKFNTLPEERQAFVNDRLEEITEYLAYLQKLMNQRPSIYAISTEASLDNYVDHLQPKGDLALPHKEWEETPAGRLHRRRLDAAAALQRAVQQLRNWYVENTDLVSRLWSFPGYPSYQANIDWPGWTTDVENVLDRKYQPPFRELEPIPGVPDGTMTYGIAYRFDRVIDARTTWELERSRLKDLLDLTTAVGLARPTKQRPAVLVCPPKPTLAVVRQRLRELKIAYPEYEKTFTRRAVPELLLPVLERVCRAQYQAWLEPARAEVLRQLQLAGRGNEETVARWEKVRTWLRQPNELTAWRELTGVLLRLADPAAEDPVAALANFLARSQLVIEKVKSVQVEIPQISGLQPREGAQLAIYQSRTAREPAMAFEPARGEPVVDRARGVVTYTFLPVSSGQRLVFKPGEELSARLLLRGGKERLVWAGGRSALYQIESLRRPPRLQSVDAKTLTEGRALPDVRLLFRPEDSVPTVPDLMPDVKLIE